MQAWKRHVAERKHMAKLVAQTMEARSLWIVKHALAQCIKVRITKDEH
jgi:hypothetical protein